MFSLTFTCIYMCMYVCIMQVLFMILVYIVYMHVYQCFPKDINQASHNHTHLSTTPTNHTYCLHLNYVSCTIRQIITTEVMYMYKQII